MYNDKKIVMCGCCDFGKYLIENLINSGVKFDFFVTITPEQAEESKVSGYYDFRLLADKYNIPYYIPKQYSMKNADDEKFFITQKFDY
jgi:methionyl-tRNA formyltransferase